MEKTRTMGMGERDAVCAALGALSHDLYTPIAGIMGMASLALEPDASGEQMRAALRATLSAARAMARVVDALGPRAREERIDGAQLAEELEAAVGTQALRKGQRLTLDTAALGEGRYAGDAAALWRVLLNLLTNAVKYTPEGGVIALHTAVEPGRGGREEAVFLVRDSGVGMSPEFMREMYEPHARAEATADEPGQGIGLSVVRALVCAMGGTLHASSVRGVGTAFTVRVPLRRAAQRATGALASLAGARILLAEDNALCAQVAARLLAREGARVTLAGDGAQAVARFAEGAFDAVLLDLHMPGMDGAGAARAIRATRAGRDVPMLALTASADAQELAAARDAGMDGVVTKPLEVERVQRALAAARADFLAPRNEFDANA